LIAKKHRYHKFSGNSDTTSNI